MDRVKTEAIFGKILLPFSIIERHAHHYFQKIIIGFFFMGDSIKNLKSIG